MAAFTSVVQFTDGTLSFPFHLDVVTVDSSVEIGCMVKGLCQDFEKYSVVCDKKKTIDECARVATILGSEIPNYDKIIDLARFVSLPVIFSITQPKVSKKGTLVGKGHITLFLFGGDWSRITSKQLRSYLGIPAPSDNILKNIYKEIGRTVSWSSGCNDHIFTLCCDTDNIRRGEPYSIDRWENYVNSVAIALQSIGHNVGYLHRCYNYYDNWKYKHVFQDTTPKSVKEEFWEYVDKVEWFPERNAITPECDFEAIFPEHTNISRIALHGSRGIKFNKKLREIEYKHLWIYTKKYQ
jgi:hypothetical protein